MEYSISYFRKEGYKEGIKIAYDEQVQEIGIHCIKMLKKRTKVNIYEAMKILEIKESDYGIYVDLFKKEDMRNRIPDNIK